MQNAVEPAFSKIFFKFAQIFEIFYHSRFHRKREAWLSVVRKQGVIFSVVFVTVRFWIVLAYSAKKRNQTSRFWQKRRVKLIVVGKMRSKTVRFRQYTAYLEMKRNYAFSANEQSET
jgi:hypothetical protein